VVLVASALLEEKIRAVLDELAPMKIFQPSVRRKTWIRRETKVMMRRRDQLREIARMDGTKDGNRHFESCSHKFGKI